MQNTNLRRIVVSLDGNERSALAELARQELRDPRAQARLILRRELERKGFLPTTEARQHQPQGVTL